LFVARSYGFLGSLRFALPEITIVESKPDDLADDLRLFDPFPELAKFSAGVDVASLDEHLHAHVPYVVLLIQHMAKWKAEHGGKTPQSEQERKEFQQQIRRDSPEAKEGNYIEAIESSYKACAPTEVSHNVKQILADEKARNLTKDSSDFWIMTSAVKEFLAEEGVLPLNGSLPDMTADTATYMALQTVYQTKALRDVDRVQSLVIAALTHLGKSPDSIPHNEVKKFCKNVQSLRVVRARPLAQEYHKDTANSSYIGSELDDPSSNMQFYVLLRAADRFNEIHKRYPGWTDEQVLQDISGLKEIVVGLLHEWGVDENAVPETSIHEMCRFGASELHNVAAFVGGVVSQEVLKVITQQWVPLNNTFLYNAMNSSTSQFQL